MLPLSSVCQSAEVPESLLPPMVRPVGRINLQMPVQNPYQQRFYNGNNSASAVFSLDGKYMASMDVQAALQLYDAGTGKILRQINHNTMLNCLTFTPDGKTLLGTQADNMGMGVHLFDVASGKHLRQLDEGANEINISAVAWSPDGTKLALAGVNQQRNTGPIIVLWDAASGDEIRKITGLPGAAAAAGPGAMNPWMMRRQQQNGPLECIAFAPDGKSLAVVIDRTIHLVELATGKVRGQAGTLPNAKQQYDDETIQMMRMQGMRGWQQGGMTGATCIAFSPDGRTIAAGCYDETIRLYDVLTARELPPLTGHRGGIRALCFSSSGKSLKSIGVDSRILVWRADGPALTWQPRTAKLAPEALAALWDTLDSDDPWLIHAVQSNLAAVPAQSMPFIRERLKPAATAEGKLIAKLITDLQNEDYNTRKKALAQIKKMGDVALPALREAQAATNSQPLMMLMMRLDGDRHGAHEQQLLAVDVLERIGTAEARELLTTLSKGAATAPLTVRAKAALDTLAKRGDARGDAKLETLWADLGSEDVLKAYTALRALARRPAEAVPMLRQKLRGVLAAKAPDDDPRRIDRLITELDNDDYAIREKANDELKKLGRRAEKQLRQRLKDGSTPEARKRIDELLKDAAQPAPSRDAFCLQRGLETLEIIGQPEARTALEDLARDANTQAMRDSILAGLRRLDALAAEKVR